MVTRLGIFHGTERNNPRNNLTELLRYKAQNEWKSHGVFVRHALSGFTGLYTSCAPRISMNEYNITVSVLLLHSSFKNFRSCCKIAIYIPAQAGEYTDIWH